MFDINTTAFWTLSGGVFSLITISKAAYLNLISMKENMFQNWRSCLPFIILMSGSYLLYIQMFSGVWLMDDLSVLVNNPDIRSFSNFLENYYPGRPLRELTYLVDYYSFGLEPSGYYIQHIFWHGLSAWLVFQLARQLGAVLPVAWFSALLFLLHPVQVEVVANISHRKDSLVLVFCLLSFCSYLRGRTTPTGRGRWWFAGALLLWIVALTAKQNALALPLVAVVYEVHRLAGEYRRTAFSLLVAILFVGLTGRLIYMATDPAFIDEIGPALFKLGFVGESVNSYFLTVFKAWAFMVSKLLYPVALSMEYTFQVPTRWTDPWVVSGVVLAGAAVAGFVWSSRYSILVCLPLTWLIAFWVPTSNLLGHLSYFAADRYWYAPAVGISILSSYGLWKLLRKHLAIYALLALLLLSSFAWQTWQQQKFWCDADKFYAHMLQVSPLSLEGLIGSGDTAMKRGEYEEAADYLRKALQRSPQDSRIPQNLGNIAYKKGQYNMAVSYFKMAIAAEPGLIVAYNNLGSVYDDLGQSQQAIEILQKALLINAHYEKGYMNLGMVYEGMGQLQKAESLYRRALKELPDYGQAHFGLGVVLYRMGRKYEAFESFSVAVRLLPEDADALYNYATVANELGQHDSLPLILSRLRVIDSPLAVQLEKELRQ